MVENFLMSISWMIPTENCFCFGDYQGVKGERFGALRVRFSAGYYQRLDGLT
jgi:hypothetical protein